MPRFSSLYKSLKYIRPYSVFLWLLLGKIYSYQALLVKSVGESNETNLASLY